MKRLFTVGYEGATLADFFGTLKAAGVTTLLDVRELPLSRRKGFSKQALAAALLAQGIAYRHERALGTPKPIRRRLAEDGDYPAYFEAFGTHLRSQTELLSDLARSISGSVALMCFERDPALCHRSVVAGRLETLAGLTVRHLEVAHGAAEKRTSRDPGEGVPAAKPKVRRDGLLCRDHA